MRIDPADQLRRRELAAALALAADHLDDLAAAGDQLAERARRLVRQSAWLRLDRLGEPGDGFGIQPIRLRQTSGGAGEVADLARVDHRQGQPGCGERRSDRDLEAAGGFEHHEPRRHRRQPFHQGGEAGGIPADRKSLSGRP
jgi:hypothetical protein